MLWISNHVRQRLRPQRSKLTIISGCAIFRQDFACILTNTNSSVVLGGLAKSHVGRSLDFRFKESERDWWIYLLRNLSISCLPLSEMPKAGPSLIGRSTLQELINLVIHVSVACNQIYENFFGMFEEMTMYDVMLWFVRMSVPLLIYRMYFGVSARSSACKNPSGRSISGKQHFTISSDRPLFQIRESRDLDDRQTGPERPNCFPLTSRESLLGVFKKSFCMSSAVVLFKSKPPSGVAAHSAPRDYPSPEEEKLYLQSLVQFRALRSSGLNHASWEQWNEEAQRILNGAALLGCAGVPAEVYDTMTMAGVLPESDTFLLLVRTAISVGQLTTARTFLTEMSNAGFLPPRQLVDEVSRGLNQSVSQGPSLNKYAPEFVPALPKASRNSGEGLVSFRE